MRSFSTEKPSTGFFRLFTESREKAERHRARLQEAIKAAKIEAEKQIEELERLTQRMTSSDLPTNVAKQIRTEANKLLERFNGPLFPEDSLSSRLSDVDALTNSLTKANAMIKEMLHPTEYFAAHLGALQDDAEKTFGRPSNLWEGFNGAISCLVGAVLIMTGVFCPPAAPILFVIGGVFCLAGALQLISSLCRIKPSGMSKALYDLHDEAEHTETKHEQPLSPLSPYR